MGKAKKEDKEKASFGGAVASDLEGRSQVEVDTYHTDRNNILWWAFRLAGLGFAVYLAYTIRLYAIEEYGLVIHEFDPWFNFRATEYLHEHGVKAFFHWYDHQSWYPIGRPVGTTIYPGMQLTSVSIWHLLQTAGFPMSLNDVCCYVPAWFGVSASIFTGLLTAECSTSRNAGVIATLIMACIPAHIMRSVGGGYDNESIAMTAMCSTFYFWCRALRNDQSAIPFGIIAGLAYVYMVAAWGGYVFVINMVGVHAIFLVLIGRFTTKLYWAYTLFYAIGTFGAVQIPVVGLTPLKSLEQIGPLGVFGIMQVLYAADLIRRKRRIVEQDEIVKLRIQAFTIAGAIAAVIVAALYPTGYFGPLSSRVRGLFVRHTRTGNPLVDSVAEHQPASANAYYQYLFYTCYLAPIGFVRTFFGLHDSKYFLPLYASIAYFFSAKMVRLIILLGPITSCLSGVALAMMLEWSLDQFSGGISPSTSSSSTDSTDSNSGEKPDESTEGTTDKKKKKKKTSDQPQTTATSNKKEKSPLGPEFDAFIEQANVAYERNAVPRKFLAVLIVYQMIFRGVHFHQYCQYMAKAMSNPSIMFNAQLRDGTKVLVDDYREAYFWLRDNTPEDSRVMAWWDYGYQISGIAKRTTIADGNTWNHEHIATLGRCLVSEEKEAHRMIRHLADYVLVWSGGGGDDLAKMPHIARIANSVYNTVCEGDPLCSQLGFLDRKGTPSPFMAKSLLYKLHSGGQKPGVTVDPSRFTNVFNSKFNKVRIWKVQNIDEESKRWHMDPQNWTCDPPPHDWICKGDYSPAFKKYIKDRKDFQQLEDFNRQRDEHSEEYQRKYHEAMQKRQAGRKDASASGRH